tara:strand:+ start:815 stop:1933 length:1119 start_codon:yes stop_codon:yes gene_type:complete
MADIIKELIESLTEFEVDMDKELSMFKYDDVLEKYVNLRLKFRNIYDNNLKLNSKAHDMITSKRHDTKYRKNDEALEKIKKIGTYYESHSSKNISNDNIIEITPTTRVNVVSYMGDDKYTFNGEVVYDINRLYSINVGIYLFKNIPSEHPIAFLIKNTDYSNLINIYGEKRKLKDSFKYPGKFRLEDFYYGDIVVHIKGDFKKVTVFSYFNGYMGLLDTFRYSSNSKIGYELECLKPRGTVNILSDSSGSKYVLNSNTTYNPNKKYGMDIGVYIFEDIPSSNPIAILNTELENSALITYKGDYIVDKQKHIKLNNKLDDHYPGSLLSEYFYWGNVEVKVTGNFGMVSVFSYYNGYIGGKDLLIYSSECPRPN